MKLRPILLRGHQRPVTYCKYNRQGDLLFTCAKDQTPMLWYAQTGERIGTYNKHDGAVSMLDINWTSTRLLTGSADRYLKCWNAQNGKEIFNIPHNSVVRVVQWAEGDRKFLSAADPDLKQPDSQKKARINIWTLSEDDCDILGNNAEPISSFCVHSDKINCVLWGPLNQTLISCSVDTTIKQWDVETEKELKTISDHTDEVRSIQYSYDKTLFVSASLDKTARLYDARSFQLIKTYSTDRPLHCAAISPSLHHVICCGGQEERDVALTDSRAAHFEVSFYKTVYQTHLADVSGHFGTVHYVAFNPDGKSFVSCSEDGTSRINHFADDYFTSDEYLECIDLRKM